MPKRTRHFRSPLRLNVSFCSCKEPVEPLSLDEVADRCHAPEDVNALLSISPFRAVSHIQVKASLTPFFLFVCLCIFLRSK